jgi:hypothetical protein
VPDKLFLAGCCGGRKALLLERDAPPWTRQIAAIARTRKFNYINMLNQNPDIEIDPSAGRA